MRVARATPEVERAVLVSARDGPGELGTVRREPVLAERFPLREVLVGDKGFALRQGGAAERDEENGGESK